MFSAQQLQQKVQEWISGRIALRDFHLWFVSQGSDASDEIARKLESQVDLLLAEHTGGYLPLADLRQELANAIRPFEKIDRAKHPFRFEVTSIRGIPLHDAPAEGRSAVRIAKTVLSSETLGGYRTATAARRVWVPRLAHAV
jgi:hypothetical protein